MTSNQRSTMAPIRIAITEVSPMVPAVFPRNISRTCTDSPAFKAARGVALETPSQVKSVILPAKEIRRKHLPARAGFIKFCPRPPKSCLTKRIANTFPMTGSQRGTVEGRFSPRRRPVTAALKSPMVIFLCISFS